MKRLFIISLISFLFIGCEAPNQANPGEPAGPHTSAEWRIWAYSTAAPAFIASNATVLDANMEPLRVGTNGWTCLAASPRGMSDPENGWKNPHEAMPVCADGESMKWMQGFMSQTEPKLDRDGFAWMLHGDTGEDLSLIHI